MRSPPRWAALTALPLAVACATTPAVTPLPSAAFPRADSRTETVVPGVTWTQVHDARGPWAVHVLRIDLDRCRPLVRAAKSGPPLSARARTSDLGGAALAAINADFFELPGGMTVGAHVSGGTVLIGPGERPVLAFTATGPVQGPATLEGWIAHGADTVPLVQVNRRPGPGARPDGVRLFTPESAPDSVAAPLLLRRVDGNGRSGTAVVVGTAGGTSLRAGSGDMLVSGAADWIERRSSGDTVAWSVRLRVEGWDPSVLEAVGGFPTLIRNGRDVLPDQPGVRPDFGARRHPRTAVGWNDRAIFWVVIDGRQAPYSDGMTLPELADLFLRIGAREAINLDGGGSTAMVVRGRVVNRPSDAQGERAVGNALLLEGCARP